jgi:dolichol-phosphate mannosyltransferase
VAQPWLSVVIPTYNEAANIGPLLAALRETLGTIPVEYVVVDDNSKDGTPEAAKAAAPEARVIVRKDERGLATAVVRGLREATGTYVAVMDADFQHPPSAVLAMLEKALDEDADLVIGSRYAAGGSQGNFGPVRRLISWGAGTIGRLALPPVRRFKLTDPMSGLFLVRRDKIDAEALRPSGYKILLEIIGRAPLERVVEVGYVFQDRRGGESKLGAGVMGQYLQHAVRLGIDHPDNRRVAKFGLVGLSGVVVNLALLWLLHGQLGLHDLVAVPIAIEASILSNFLLNDRFTFRDRQRGHVAQRLFQFNLVSLLALVVNLAAYTLLAKGMGMHYLAAEAIAIVIAFGANYAGNLHWTYRREGGFSLRKVARASLPFLPVFLVAGAAGFVYLHDVDRVPEIYFDEHYYISVARQMDNGIWEDPCWTHDTLGNRPLNYEHPPLAKLLMYWSVKSLDTDHAVFAGPDPGPGVPHPGCRSPDSTAPLPVPCQLVEDDLVLGTYPTGKECYDAFTARAKQLGNPLAWRLPSALLGTAAVLFAGLAAHRLFSSSFAGGLGAALVLMDTLMFTSARLAILDIFCAGFTMAAVWAATFPTKKGLFWTATLLGLAFASKYSVLFAGPAVLAVALWSHHRAGLLTRRRFDLSFVLFALMPLVVWVATYWPWWARWVPEHGVSWSARHWFDLQKIAFSWGTSGYDSHPYASPPAEWFAMVKPTWYYHVWGLEGGKEGWVYAVGNPLLWWFGAAVALAALLWVPTRWVIALLRTGWVNPLRHVGALTPTMQAVTISALLPVTAYAGFFLVDRVTFLFYMTLIVPLLCLPLAGALDAWWRRGVGAKVTVSAIVALVLAGFLYYHPVAASMPISPERFHDIMGTLPWMSE